MAIYLEEFKRTKNNLENRSNNKNFDLGFAREGSEGRRPGPQEIGLPYSYGDTVVVGSLPGGSIITKVTVLVREPFDAGTTLDLGLSADYPSLSILPIYQNGDSILVDEGSVSISHYLTTSGSRDAAGVLLADDTGLASIWIGGEDKKGDFYVTATFGGGTGELTSGECTIIVSYERFGTNVGAY